jgi:ubiquinone/menaquinone biosynthesis C-methylase UbiE
LYSTVGVRAFYSLPVGCVANSLDLKQRVAEFWDLQPCGTRYFDTHSAFKSHADARYQLEPHIPVFAGFSSARGLKVLEVGVGIGADYEQWLNAGAIATGIDLSSASLDFTRKRCTLAGLEPDLHHADAENLPFASNIFDLVYSYGVMHHSPDTAKCLQEAWRVLKPGGEVRIMLYQHPSLTGLMLWLRYGLWRAQSIRQCVYEYLESPGTKTFTQREAEELMQRFENVRIERVFSPGDLLLHQPSQRFNATAYRLLWKVFPRGLVRKLGRRWGLFLLIAGRKRA